MFVVQRRILQEEAPPPSQLFAGLPLSLDAIVARALAKRPEDRYESAAAFAHDLRRVAADYLPSPPLPVAPGSPVAGTSQPVDVQLDMPPAASPAPQSWVAPAAAAAPAAPSTRPAGPATAWPWWLLGGVLVAAALAWWLMRAPALPAPVAAPEPPREAASAPVAPAAPVVVAPVVPPVVTPPVSAPDPAPSAAATPTQARPASAAAPRPAPAPKTERPTPTSPPPVPATQSGGAMRCADILERMQLGEPLSAEQSSFFQNRCAR